jgi:tetratricopeptide (TPR) repeat protein
MLDVAHGTRDQGCAAIAASLSADTEVGIKSRACGRLAEVALLEGNPAAARTYLAPSARWGEELYSQGRRNLRFPLPPIGFLREGEQLYAQETALLAWTLLEVGEHDHAAALLERILEQARREERRVLLADALRVQAQLAIRQARWPETQAALDEALVVSRAIPYPYAEAKALSIYSQLHTARGEPELARACLQTALAICSRLGEGLYRPHIEQALTRLGQATP